MSQARDEFAELVNQAVYKRERVRLTRRGKPVAAIISMEDLEFLERLEDELDSLTMDRVLAEEPADTWSSLEEVAKRLGLPT
jgi:prevent-host-death family protein